MASRACRLDRAARMCSLVGLREGSASNGRMLKRTDMTSEATIEKGRGHAVSISSHVYKPRKPRTIARCS